MNLTRLSTKHPAAVVVAVALSMVFGLIALYKLPSQLLPTIEQPQITVSTSWRAAAPQELEAAIIEPQENVLQNIQGVTDIFTNVRRGSGNIILMFEVGTDMQAAMLEVINNLNQAPPLPLDASEPRVFQGGGSANAASLLIRPLPGNDINDLTVHQKLFDDIVEPRLARINGVSRVNLNSRRPDELRITFDPYKLAALGVGINQISSTIARASDVSGGFADVGRRQYTVRFTGKYDVDSLEEMIIAYSNERPIYLKDVAQVAKTKVDRFGFTLRNGAPGYYITINPANNINMVQLLADIKLAITDLNAGPLQEVGLKIDLSFDSSVHILNAIELVLSNLGLGVLLALGVLLFFLRGVRTTLIIATTIPVSLCVAFVTLQIFERSLNVISLAGLAFSVGLVLDAAIIVQENIVRLRAEGLSAAKAVLRGAQQVSGALFASTATSVAIFLPILFMAGLEGQLFSDLAITLAIAVVASFVAAITVLPVASRFWLKSLTQQDPFEHYWQRLTALVMKLTDSSVKRSAWIATLLGGSVTVVLLLMPKTDFLPRAPIDGFFFNFNMPPGGNIDTVEAELVPLVKTRLAPYVSGEKQPAIKDYNFYSFGPGASGGFIYAADPQRVEELMNVVRTQIFDNLPDAQVFLFRGSMIRMSGGSGGQGINIDLQGPDIEALMAAAQKGMAVINEQLPGSFPRPNPGLQLAEPELQLIPDDRRITQAGIDRLTLANAIRAMTGGLFISEYFDGNDRMNVILRGNEWRTPEQLAATPIYTPQAGVQTIGELASVIRTVGPTQLRRVDGQRTVTITLTPPNGMSMQETLALIEQKVKPAINAELPEGSRMLVSGSADRMAGAIVDMTINFMLALMILFLLMAALFKSARDSLLVLLVMPMALAGGVLALQLLNLVTFQSLDLLTMIGFIILLGLVVNNAILLVDQTRCAERDGLARSDAVAQAVQVRARPIYMSTLTSLFGMLPLMLMPGVGSEIYRGLATVIVGGMAVSAVFTLVLLPSLLRIGETRSAAALNLSSMPSDNGITTVGATH